MSEAGRPKRRVNPMLLLGEDEQPTVKKTTPASKPPVAKAPEVPQPTQKTDVSQVRKPSTGVTQENIVDTEDFSKKKPTNPLLRPGATTAPAFPGVPKKAPAFPKPATDTTPARKQTIAESLGKTSVTEEPKAGPARKQTIAESLGKASVTEEPKTGPAKVDVPKLETKNVPKLPTVNEPAGRKVNPMFGLSGETGKPVAGIPNVGNKPSTRTTGRTLRVNPIVNLGVDDTPTVPKRNTDNLFKEKEDAKPRSRYTKKMVPQIEAEEWTEDTTTDTAMGLGGENDSAAPKPQYEKGIHMTDRDIIIIRFLARYRYAYTDQLARLVDTTPRTIMARLRKLEERGFIRREKITDKQYLWVSRKAGNTLVDINFTEAKKGSLSYITLPHTIGLVNLGCEFEREVGGKDLLGEGKGQLEWTPPKERSKFGIWGYEDNEHLGYMTVTEREIRQAQLRNRGGRDTKEMRELVHLAFNQPDPIELEEGQEHLFIIYGAGGAAGEHIPDLVVTRPRDENGRPQHIAIELELTPKQPAEWKKILRNFRDNAPQYEKIVYFTHKRSIMNGIMDADREVGLGDKLVIRKYVPNKNSNLPFWG